MTLFRRLGYRGRVLLLVSACAVRSGAQENPAPGLRAPKLNQTPTLDGRIESREWSQAAAFTGLVIPSAEHALAPPEMQAVIRVAYDDRFLYVAMRAPNPRGHYPVGRAGRPDAPEIPEDHHFQLLLVAGERARAARNGEGYYRISVNPLGAVEDRWLNSGRADRELLWSHGGEARCLVTPESWELELSVAWSSLGVDAPDGRTIHGQFILAGGTGARAWAAASGPRPWEGWGAIELRPGPAAQVVGFGEVGGGELETRARTVGASAPRASLRLLNDAGAPLVEESSVQAEMLVRRREISLSDSGNTLELNIRDGDAVLYHQRVRVDRWTDAWRNRHLKPWLNSFTNTPPRAVSFPEDDPQSLLVFLSAQRKRIRPLEVAFGAAQQAGDRAAMAEIGRRLMREAPFLPTGYFLTALDEAARGRKEEALGLLEKAVDKGFNNAQAIATATELQPLRESDAFRALLARASSSRGMTIPARAEPAEVTTPAVVVDDKNVTLHPQIGLPVALYRFAPQPPPDRAVTGLRGTAGDLIRAWYAEGRAAGNWGDLYDNRDNGHSRLSAGLFPQLTHIQYGEFARAADLHNGLASTIVHDGVLIGNASLAVTGGPFWRSLVRTAHADARIMSLFFALYRGGQLYVHPAHMDFPREKSEEEGLTPARRDVFFTNAPFPLVSRGSSGSDRPHLEALAAMLAAFQPDVKRALRERGLLMPTLQMLLRRHYVGVESDEDYLTGRAHPPLFAGSNLRLEPMVRAAHEIPLTALPPWAEIRVVEADLPRIGVEYFEAPGRTEEIFTTPAAVARIFRGISLRRRYVLSAEGSADANGRPLAFHWRLLQGDPARVVIRSMGERSERAEITIAWHPPIPAASEPNVMSSRVDIGLFAHNGKHFSAPAFFTIYFPPSEERVYGEDGRIRSVRYRKGTSAPYTDPVIYTPREWTDEYEYGPDGQMTGWTRLMGGRRERYDAGGRRVGADGTPRETVYRLVADGALMKLEPAP